MATFSIESNGRIEKTAIYYNGEQIGGVKEVMLNLSEDGTFDAVIQYQGKDNNIHTKQIFTDYLENLRVTEPSFTDEEARELRLLTVDSDGDIENTLVLLNDMPLEGLVDLMIQIRGGGGATHQGGIRGLFGGRNDDAPRQEFRAEATFRNEDDSLSTEYIFQ